MTWDEVLPLLAEKFTQLKLSHGADAIAGLITARCTNEDLYVFQKFMRLAIGSNHLDSSARYGHVNAVEALRRVQGTNRWTVSYEDILEADTLLLVGTQITFANPIVGLKVKEAVKKRGAKLLTIETGLPSIETTSNIVNLSSVHLCVPFDRQADAVQGLVKALFDDNLVGTDIRIRRCRLCGEDQSSSHGDYPIPTALIQQRSVPSRRLWPGRIVA